MLVDTASLSGSILLIIGAATGMAWALTQSGFGVKPYSLAMGTPKVADEVRLTLDVTRTHPRPPAAGQATERSLS